MKTFLTSLLLAAGFLFQGCESTPTRVASGPIRGETFNFVTPTANRVAEYAEKRAEINQLIQSAIVTNLTSKGLGYVASDGQVSVGYLLILGNNVTTGMVSDYFENRDEAKALESVAHAAYTSPTNEFSFQAGTLVIDIRDNRTYKLLSRGYATRRLLKDPSPEVRASRIQEVVNEILADVKVEK
ncbi:MAG: DUF4136 domain-containing protein [Verrucomicrobiota bacterium]